MSDGKLMQEFLYAYRKGISERRYGPLAAKRGWHDKDRNVDTFRCFLHAEVCEALEKYRKKNPRNDDFQPFCNRLHDYICDLGDDYVSEILLGVPCGGGEC